MLRRRINNTLRKPSPPTCARAGCANNVCRRPETHPAGERIINQKIALPVITAYKVVITV
jgi:hypothetical protein